MLNRYLRLWLALAAAAARASGLRPARALVGHDHEHPVCDEEYRTTVCPAACDADTLREVMETASPSSLPYNRTSPARSW